MSWSKLLPFRSLQRSTGSFKTSTCPNCGRGNKEMFSNYFWQIFITFFKCFHGYSLHKISSILKNVLRTFAKCWRKVVFPQPMFPSTRTVKGLVLATAICKICTFDFFALLLSLKLFKGFASPSVKYAILRVLQKLPYCLPRYQRHISPYLSIIEKLETYLLTIE